MEKSKFIIFFKRRIEPFIALGVLILLIVLVVQLYKGNELREEISETCGWEGEDYRCFCEKSEAMQIKDYMDNNVELDGDIEYVQVGG